MGEDKAAVVWFDIRVSDLRKAAEFYGALFGWEFDPFDEYDHNYWVIRGAKASVGGALVLCPGGWSGGGGTVLFMAVPDLEAALNKALSFGGIIEQPTKRISDRAGSFALIRDLDANVVGLWCAEST